MNFEDFWTSALEKMLSLLPKVDLNFDFTSIDNFFDYLKAVCYILPFKTVKSILLMLLSFLTFQLGFTVFTYIFKRLRG